MFQKLTFDIVKGTEELMEYTERKWAETDPKVKEAIEIFLENLNDSLGYVSVSLHFQEDGRVRVQVYNSPNHADYDPEHPNRYVSCVFGNRK